MGAPDVRTPQVPAGALKEKQDNQPADCGDLPPVEQPMSHYGRKRQAGLQAGAALRGVALRRLANGRWLACRWNLSKELADIEIDAWLRRVEVSQ